MPEPYNTHVCPTSEQEGVTPEQVLRLHIAGIVLPDILATGIFTNPCNDVYKALVEVTEAMRQFHNFAPYTAGEEATFIATGLRKVADNGKLAKALQDFDDIGNSVDFTKLPKN